MKYNLSSTAPVTAPARPSTPVLTDYTISTSEDPCDRCNRKIALEKIHERHYLYCICHQLLSMAHHNGVPGPLGLERLDLYAETPVSSGEAPGGGLATLRCNQCKEPYTACFCHS